MKNIAIIWVIAIIVTLLAAFYQRKTGPTHPEEVRITHNNNTYAFKLPRSHAGQSDCVIELPFEDSLLEVVVIFKHYPTDEEWMSQSLKRSNNKLITRLPNQPPAGKLVYCVTIYEIPFNKVIYRSPELIIRFRGEVPSYYLIMHAFLMFLAMLFSNLSGLLVIYNFKKYKLYVNLTFFSLLIGGMILGPIVQLYAFGDLWTGIPYGWDLTDNKTLLSFIFWFIAFLGNRDKIRKNLVLIAAIVTLLIFSIPHSLLGSELDYSTGKVVTGFISIK